MKDILFIFGILLSFGLLGVLGWFIYWKHKEKNTAEPSKNVGKRMVMRAINRVTTPQIVLADYTVKGNTYTAEIDFVVLNAYGVFILSVLRYPGKITGSRDDEEWLQTQTDGSVNAFYNPIHKNAAHIRFLRSFLPEDAPFRSVVVFLNDNTDGINENATEAVALKKLTKRLCSGKTVLSSKQINAYARTLREKQNASR